LTISFESYLNVRSAYAPQFDASGERIAFITDLSGTAQVWAVDTDGGWPHQLTFADERVSAFSWAPKDERLIFAMDQDGNERHQLYLHSPGGADAVQLTGAPEVKHIIGPWSPDGDAIAYANNRRDPAFFDIYVQNVPDGEPRMVYRDDGSNSAVAWSPDGRYLVLSRSNTYLYNDLLLLDLGSEETRRLTPDGELASYGVLGEIDCRGVLWDRDSKGLYITTNREREFRALAYIDVAGGELAYLAEPPWDVEDVAVSPDGGMLAYVVNEAGYSRAFVRDLDRRTEVSVEGLPKGTVRNPRMGMAMAWSPDGRSLALTVDSATRTADIWLYDAVDGKSRQVTHSDMGGIPRESFVEPELVSFPTFDGRDIPAFLYAPPGAKPDGKNSVVVHIHGGPEGQDRPSFDPVYQYLVRQGYCVLAPNVRGSSGYGRTYNHLDDVRKRMDSVRDIEQGWRWLVESGWGHAERIAVMGGSYGGFMTLACITTYPELWTAAVELFGMSNLHTFLENTSSYRRRLRELEYGSLQHDADFLKEISPINHVDRVRTPLLVLHGATDARVPIAETEQMVEALRDRGMPVEYIRFEDEGHGFMRRANRLKAYPAIADFLRRRLPLE
jgi:dipeptidyl aminopeptidase/acylaminoacyl peptidase